MTDVFDMSDSMSDEPSPPPKDENSSSETDLRARMRRTQLQRPTESLGVPGGDGDDDGDDAMGEETGDGVDDADQDEYVNGDDEDEEDGEDDDEDEDDDDGDQQSSASAESAESDGRRRSGRTRTRVKPRPQPNESDEDNFEIQISMPRKSSERRKSIKKSSGKRAPPRKRSGNSTKKRVQSHSRAERSGSESDEIQEWILPPQETPVSDDEDAFIIEKVLAREVHTMKEWRRIRSNRSTRFLSNGSIFLEDGSDDEEGKPIGKKTVALDSVIDVTSDAAGDEVETGAAQTTANQSSTIGDTTPSEPISVADRPLTDNIDNEPATGEGTNIGTPALTKTDTTKLSNDDTKAPERKPQTDAPLIIVDGPTGAEEEERFLIKWKKLSYIHVSWETEKSLVEVDKQAKGKIQRFREKEMLGLMTDRMHGDEYFNPEFRDVDRILDIQDRPGDDFSPAQEDEESGYKYFLVKWKSLPYDLITWEREDDIHDDAAVSQYDQRLSRAVERYKRMATAKSNHKARKINFRGYSTTNQPQFKKDQSFELRDYQLTGVNWMLFNWYQQRSSMLADEMGLGKTVQTVTYINHLSMVEELPGPYIVVAPLSTLAHWQREFTSWTNLNAVVYHGTAQARQIIQDFEFYVTEGELSKTTSGNRGKKTAVPRLKNQTCYRFDVLITTYEMCCTSDFSKLSRVKWQVLIVDEAHRLKNRNSKLSVTLRKNFSFENVLLLTGTPLQNNIEELWTLLNILDPNKFFSMEEFLVSYGELKDSTQVEKLHAELRPFLLRRMKEDVEKSLAPKEETIIEVELTVLQKQYYRAIFEQNIEFLARGLKRSHAPTLMNVLMELRKCCNHPFLIKGMEQREVAKIQEQKLPKEEIIRKANDLLVNTSGKLILLDKLLPALKKDGHRVLIFSQFKIMLDILQDYLRFRSYRCERIDGNITGNDRQAAIDRFCDLDSTAFVMLLSTRAGGVGINLTAADTVIIYDSDWNPQNDLQAQARCHRIGQKKTVKIYRLLTAKTYELHMFHQASLKLGLDQAVLGSIRDRNPAAASTGGKKQNAPMNKAEIEHLLKHGAYEIFKEDNNGEAEEASKRFSEESIDQILSRSTKIIHDPKAGGPGGDGKTNLMSSFSKATFVSSTNPDEEVAVDDPEFWTKVIGLKAVQELTAEPSPLKKRRCRRQVKSYLHEESDNEEAKRFASMSKKRRHIPNDKDNDEFVISSSVSSEDDEDSGSDGVKKPKNELPDLCMLLERIADLLATFGYGRWDEMVTRFPILGRYPDGELRRFCCAYLARLVRIAATSTVNSNIERLQQFNSVTSGKFGQTNGAGPRQSKPFCQEDVQNWIDGFASRFKFVKAMVSDESVSGISAIPIPARLSISKLVASSDRDASNKLLQIDRLYCLHVLTKKYLMPIPPLLALIKDLQDVEESAKVELILREGTLDSIKAAVASIPSNVENEEVKEGENMATNSATTPEAATVTADGETKSTSIDSNIVSSSVGSEPDEPSAGSSSLSDQASNVPTVAVADSNMDPDGTEKVVNSEPNAPSTPATSDPASVQMTTLASLQNFSEHEIEAALERLQAMPFISMPYSVAPWWLSVVDDAMLLIHIDTNGWSKARGTPTSYYQTSMFGSRAASHNVSLWPSGAILNRRAKAVISTWTNDMRLRAHKKDKIARNTMKAKLVARTLTHNSPNAPNDNILSTDQIPEVNSTLPAKSVNALENPHDYRPLSEPSNINQNLSSTMFSARRNRFAKLIFSFGIPEVGACHTEQERQRKWRYFLEDSQLQLRRFPLADLLAEAVSLENICRARLNLPTPFEGANQANASILGGQRGTWSLTVTQCRRLVHRIELFRFLRTRLLLVPPLKLVDIVTRVVRHIRSDPGGLELPKWWNSPRHDILLLQGVECFGLDEYAGHVWKLGPFASSNVGTPFPAAGWTENYIYSLALNCKRVLKRLRQRQNEEQQQHQELRTSVAVQRIGDISGMRAEDPQFAPDVNRRMKVDTAEFTKAAHSIVAQAEIKRMEVEIAKMREEDPYFSVSVRHEWRVDIHSREKHPADVNRIPSATVLSHERSSTQDSSQARVVAPVSDSPQAAFSTVDSPITTSPSTSNRVLLADATAVVSSTPVVAATNTIDRLPATVSNEASSSASETSTPSIPRQNQQAHKRKRAPRQCDVIVIDDSSDSDAEVSVKRTTRSQRRRRGINLMDGF